MELYTVVLLKIEITNEKKIKQKTHPTSKPNSIDGLLQISGFIHLHVTKKRAIEIQNSSSIQMDKFAARCEEVQKQKNYISVALQSMQ